VEAACRELAVPERSLSDVAALTGFADRSHLSRVFRRFTGLTPGAFRKGLGSS
jgi:AraC-like DNA-binding protein